MKLSKIVEYKIKLQQHDLAVINKVANEMMMHIGSEIADDIYAKEFNDCGKNILRSVDAIIENYKNYIQSIQEQISTLEEDYYKQSLKVYTDQTVLEEYHSIMSQTFFLEEDTREYLERRLDKYTNWIYPGLQISPIFGGKDLTDAMVSLDPLYLVDYQQTLVNEITKQYNLTYRHRLRSYIMKRYDSNNTKQILFPKLPIEQFGFILACNFMDKFPLPVIEAYLLEIFNLLRPGGVMLFTFNDCDIPHNIQLVEQGYRPYTPGKEVRKLIKKLGYEILNHHSESYGIAWFEIKKPGEIKSSRGGQPLGKICHYPIPIKKEHSYLGRDRGEFSTEENYKKNDLVMFENHFYRATEHVKKGSSFNYENWSKPKRGWRNRGQFQEEHDYKKDDMVMFKGFFYRATQDVKNGPFDINEWVECGPNGEVLLEK